MTDKQDIKLVIVIQCAMAKKRCSGFLCMNAFFERDKFFEEYPKDKEIRFLPFECGGCCGKSVNSLMTNVSRKLLKEGQGKISKDEVAVHLSSCMSFDNHHSDRCPFIDLIKEAVKKQGFNNIYEGSTRSNTAERRRESGEYKTY